MADRAASSVIDYCVKGERIAAIVVDVNQTHPPLIRINLSLVEAELERVLLWADRQIRMGRRFSILPIEDLSRLTEEGAVYVAP